MSELARLPIADIERIGACNRFCGRCCSVTRWRHHPLFETELHAFFAEQGENDRGECSHLVWQNGRAVCAIYERRPELCRVFPNHPVSIAIIPECTFQFRRREPVAGEGGQP